MNAALSGVCIVFYKRIARKQPRFVRARVCVRARVRMHGDFVCVCLLFVNCAARCWRARGFTSSHTVVMDDGVTALRNYYSVFPPLFVSLIRLEAFKKAQFVLFKSNSIPVMITQLQKRA